MAGLRPKDPRIAEALGKLGPVLVRVRAALELAGDTPLAVHLAVSGGPDSMCALALLEMSAARHRLALSVGHVDHGLRPNSAREAELVEAAAQARGLPFRCTRVSLEAGPGLPARAREARYAALEAQAQGLGARVLGLGHTATDQAETLLMHLTRGCGLDGLAGMPEFDGRRLRPLLGLSRAQTRALCEQMGLAFAEDPSNEDTAHLRVEIREALLPRLRARNPRVEEAFARAAGAAADADAAIAWWVQREYAARRRPEGEHDLTDYAALPRALRTRWLRCIAQAAGVESDAFSARNVEAIDRALLEDLHAGRGVTPRRWDLPGGARVEVRRGRICVRARAEKGAAGPAQGL